MLRLLNNLANGYVAVPVIVACRKHGLLETLDLTHPIPFSELVEVLAANRGHLRTALHLLESLNWVKRTTRDEYLITKTANQSRALSSDVADLMHFPITDYLLQAESGLSLRIWIDRSKGRWGTDNSMLVEFLDGLLMIPLLVTLQQHSLISHPSEGVHELHLGNVRASVKAEILDLFSQQGWISRNSRKDTLTDAGRFILERVSILATVYSYQPLVMHVEEVIFGDCKSLFRRDSNNRELHVNRTLNVIGSGFQHDKYFSDMDEMIKSVFNQEPLAEQPKYIADMGCGNGALLKHIYAVIEHKTVRGRFLSEHPIQLIGVDFNEEALEETKRTLDGVDHVVLQGDIGNPRQLMDDLLELGIDVNRILHVRSFLDHDRPFIPPSDPQRAGLRKKSSSHAFAVNGAGGEIQSSELVQSLVEHLQRWSHVLNTHGLMVLEAHCLAPHTIRDYIDQTESLHFDTYHRFSQQLLVEADTFLMAAAEAGLFPKVNYGRKYPKTLPFCRITLNYLEPRPYRIRIAQSADLPALVKLEQACWSAELRTPVPVLAQRIQTYPEGQLLLEFDGKVMGALYSQRISSVEPLHNASVTTVASLHDKTGSLVQLLGLNVLPEMQNRNLGYDLLEFMLQRSSLMPGIQSVVGVTRCRDYHTYRHKHGEVALGTYLHLRNEAGHCVDTTLRFHERHGAQIKGLIPHYRPRDVHNQGHGVLLLYDLPTRLQNKVQTVGAQAAETEGDFAPKVALNRGAIEDRVVSAISTILGVPLNEEVPLDQPLMELGLDSADLLELEAQLSKQISVSLGSTFFFQYNTVGRIVDFMVEKTVFQVEPGAGDETAGDETDIKLLAGENEADIALIGVSCRLPKDVRNKDQLWKLLKSGISVIGALPSGRWNWPGSIDLEQEHKGIDQGGFLNEIAEFDPLFFRISPTEAELMDPQQRILLELSYECVEDAGYSPKDLWGSKTGVFIGASGSDYLRLLINQVTEAEANVASGTAMAALPNRVSYFYNLHGPSLQIDTACSSSLVAVHQAVQALVHGECEQALVGGVHIMCHPFDSMAYYQAGMLSKDGKSKTFDREANGYVRGEGAVMFLLKPLKRALADGDHVLAVIKGTAVNHGGQTSGLTVPSPEAQAAVIMDALRAANCEPNTIGYIETHGTGTALGDPIEVEGLKEAFTRLSDRDEGSTPYCGLGSIKTNLGHLEAAAGLAGLLKVVLSLRHKMLPPSLNFGELNPRITLSGSPFYVVRDLQSWPMSSRQTLRRAAVGSFGSGGTNAYVVVEAAREVTLAAIPGFPSYLVCLSAKTPQALRQRERDLLNWLYDHKDSHSLTEISAGLLVGREHFRHRAAYVVRTVQDLQLKLSAVLENKEADGHFHGVAHPPRKSPQLASQDTAQVLLRELRSAADLQFDTKIRSLATFYVNGIELDWKLMFPEGQVPRISLPTYPFARTRYWVPENMPTRAPGVSEKSAVKTQAMDDELRLFYPVWKEEPVSQGALKDPGIEPMQHLVMLCDPGGVTRESIELRLGRARCVVLQPHGDIAEQFESLAVQAFVEIQKVLQTGLRALQGVVWVQLVVFVQEEQHSLLSGLAGLLRSTTREYPELLGQLLEMEAGCNAESIAQRLRENWPVLRDYVRYQSGTRWVMEWREALKPEIEAYATWRDRGIYLITGGAGGLGRIFAREIAQRTIKPTLILTGRSNLSEEQQNFIRELSAKGVRVEYRQVDVTDLAAVERLVQRIHEDYGGLHGILHCAGVIRDNYLRLKTNQEWHEVLGPKVQGLWNLDRAARDSNLDWFILFSSLASVLGNPGQSDYAAANAFMDAYAAYRNVLVQAGQRHGYTLSVNWPLWREGGMQVDAETSRRLEQIWGMEPLHTSNGIQALHLGLKIGRGLERRDQVLVGTGTRLRLPGPIIPLQPVPADGNNVHASIHFREDGAFPASKASSLLQIQEELRVLVSQLLKMQRDVLDVNVELGDYGFDSILFTALVNRMNEKYQVELSPAIFFEHSTIEELAQYLLKQMQIAHRKPLPRSQGSENAPGVTLGRPADATFRATSDSPESIAIVGVSCQFPGASDINQFWTNLKNGTDCIREISKDRWDWETHYGEAAVPLNKTTVKWGGFIDGADEFDPLFFGISPSEAEVMDPQHRLLLTHTWRAIEDAGYAAKDLSGTQTGVFTAIAGGGYSTLLLKSGSQIDGHYATGNMPSAGPNRISYMFNFHGPSEPVETACSSGLVAIHRAVAAIQDGSCEMALAGGVNLLLTPELQISFEQAGMLSKDGRCKTFSNRANGYVRGEGVGMLLLKKLTDAQRDGDHIYGVIRSTAVNHGGHANSLTAPNTKAQTQLLLTAYRQAGLDARTVTYIETHGTGTPLGDPVEINALKAAFKELYETDLYPNSYETSREHHFALCGLGSVKTNIGHLELAAGIAGVIKVLLQMKHKTLVKNLHYTAVNPLLELEGSPFYIVEDNREWKSIQDDNGRPLPRRAGVSSFGFGGSNAHIVLEEYLQDERQGNIPVASINGNHNGPVLILLSAKREPQLREQAQQLLNAIQDGWFSGAGLADLAYTLQVGREPMAERLAFMVESFSELEQKLQGFIDGVEETTGLYRGSAQGSQRIPSMFASDPDFQRFVQGWVAQKRYPQLLTLWSNGWNPDWNGLYSDTKPQRMSLPTYPFAKAKYWLPHKTVVDTSDSRQPPVAFAKQRRIHPLLHETVLHENASTLAQQGFKSTFTGDEFFLRDHVVRGQQILPAVTYLEMARAAVEYANEDATETVVHRASPLRLSQVVLVRPFVVGDMPSEANIRLEPQKDGRISFKVYGPSRDGQEELILYTQGRAEGNARVKAPVLDLTQLRSQCQASPLTSKQWYDLLQVTGFAFGPGHRGIEQIYVNSSQVLARLRLPEAVFPTKDEFFLHPSVLDSALQASIALMSDIVPGKTSVTTGRDGQEVFVCGFLPFAFDEVQILSRTPTTAWAFIRDSEGRTTGNTIRKLDIDVCDDHGVVCVRIQGLTLRSFDRVSHTVSSEEERNLEVEDLMLAPVWDPIPLTSRQPQESSAGVLLMGGAQEDLESLCAHMPHARLIELKVEDSIAVIEEQLREAGPIDEVWWLAPRGNLASVTKESIIANQGGGVLQVFRIVKALLRLNYEQRKLSITIMTVQSQPVLQHEPVHPEHASIMGFAGTMSQEFPSWQVRLVDLPSKGEWPLQDLPSIPASLAGNGFAYRGETWYRQTLIPVETGFENDQTAYRHGGVYVIIGGAGGIGQVWSEYLIRHHQAQVLWIGRRPIDESIRAKISELSKFGPRVRYFMADAADFRALQRSYETIKQEFPEIHGVVHSAVVLHDESLITMNEDRFCTVLKTKLDVSVRIAQVFQGEPLDFILFFSSLNSFLKRPGQSNYNSGSTFLDAFAYQLGREWSCKVKVMNWGYWGDVGVVASPAYRSRMAAQGMNSINSASAMDALKILLVGPLNQAVFMKATPHLNLEIISWNETTVVHSSAVESQMVVLKLRMTSIVRNKIHPSVSRSVRESSDLAGLNVDVSTALRQAAADCLHVSEEQIDLESSWDEYGFDRVTLTEFLSKINQQFDVEFTLSTVVQHPTIQDLGQYLMTQDKIAQTRMIPERGAVSEENRSHTVQSTMDTTK